MSRYFHRRCVIQPVGLLALLLLLAGCRQPLATTTDDAACADCLTPSSGAVGNVVVDEDDAGFGASILVTERDGSAGLVAYTTRGAFGQASGELRLARWRARVQGDPQLDVRTIGDVAAETARIVRDASGVFNIVAAVPGDAGATLGVFRAGAFDGGWTLKLADQGLPAGAWIDAASDSSGLVHVVWVDPETSSLLYVALSDGAPVAAPLPVDGGGAEGVRVDAAVSITVGVDGVPLVSYQDSSRGQLRFARLNEAGDGWTIEVVGRSRRGVVVLPDADGTVELPFGYVARADQVTLYENLEPQPDERLTLISDTQLQIDDVHAGAEYSLDYVEPVGADYGRWSSIAVAQDGTARIAFYDFRKGALWYAQQTGAAGTSSWAVEAIDLFGLVGDFADLVLARIDGADGAQVVPVVAYQDTGNADLMLAWRGLDGWSSHRLRLDAAGMKGMNPSLAVLSNGRAIVAHRELDPYAFRSRLRLASALLMAE